MVPYTYLIGWTDKNKYYYGVRYAKDCDPSELWVKYFTSSKHVKKFANKHGAPDLIEIRKTFNTIDEATQWENKVLKRLNVVEDKRFLNATANIAIICRKEFDRGANFSEWNKLSYKEKYTLEQRQNIAKNASERMAMMHREGKITYKKPEDTTAYKNAALSRWSDPQFKAKQKSRKWINNGKKSKIVLPEELSQYLDSGWNLGRVGG